MNVHYARYIVCHVVYTYSDSSTVADQGGAPFFRVAPDFVVQFGIAGTPGKNSKWTNPIKDDPVVQSNIAWTVSYATAGPDTRTTQLFINLQDNSGLDSQGFAPVGVILDRESQEPGRLHGARSGPADEEGRRVGERGRLQVQLHQNHHHAHQ
jgi:hypothetical protein